MKHHAMKSTAIALGTILALSTFAQGQDHADSLLADLAPKKEVTPKKEVAPPVQAPKPAAVPKPAAAPKQAEPVKSVESKTVETAKPAENIKPVKEAKAKEAKPAESVKPPEEVKPVETVKAEKPQPAAVPAEEVAADAKPAEEGVDEIDLDKADDSAVAAKGRPVVKMAPPDAKPTAEALPVAAGPVAENVQPSDASASHKTGTDIAAKFLASDETALVDIMSDDATLTDILRQFRKATGANIIYAESTNLHQRVSVSLKHVPWLQAMRSILNSRGFRVESSAGIHFVKEDKLADPVFTRSFQLKHASAEELSVLFNGTYGVKDKAGKLIHGIATPFQGANTVVVTASDRVLADCEAIIQAVDKAVPQIYIEARFIELSNEAMHKLGVQWDQLESWGASVHDLNGGMEYNNGRLNKYAAGTTPHYYDVQTYKADGTAVSTGRKALDYVEKNQLLFANEGQTPGTDRLIGDSDKNGFHDQALGRSADMAWRNARVFSGQLSADDFRLAMSAFEQLQDARVFSNPKVIVSNGKEAFVDMTTKFPNVKVQATRNNSNGSDSLDISTQLEAIPGEDKLMFAKEVFFSWGITLSVKPRISPDGLISVEIVPTISQLDSEYGDNGFYQVKGGDSSAYSTYPIIQIKRLTTDFTMKDGATAVIGGLSKTVESDIDSGIPYLRKIPWIGQKLFGWKSRGKVQKEILVFVTVGIADPADLPEYIGLPKNAVRGREYVEKRAFEPGDRPNAATDIIKLDTRTIEEQAAEREKAAPAPAKKEEEPHGTVTITPVAP